MPKVYVSRVIIDPSIVDKINSKHAPLTADDVREAILYGRYLASAWQDNEKHGRRLVIRAQTRGGALFIAFLIPANEGDPDEGTFVLKTAIPEKPSRA